LREDSKILNKTDEPEQMPFVRRTPNTAGRPPAGTIPSPSAPSVALISTGIPSFDDILGGGQPVGSILTVLAPDEHSAWSRLVERYWIAQGLAAGQDVLVIGGSTDDSANAKSNVELEDLVAGCMWLDEGVRKSTRQIIPESAQPNPVPEDPDSDAEGLDEESSNRTKIAWRYENMKKFQTTVSGNNAGGKLISFSPASACSW
jgi:elongator complex protein 4